MQKLIKLIILSCFFTPLTKVVVGAKNIVNNPTNYVDPFIGSAGNGHTSPSACVPFGLVQAGPQTGFFTWAYCGGYQHSDSLLYGFSQTRLNGTGCPDLGDLLILPFSGNPNQESYSGVMDKDSEKASPGYYSVYLTDDKIDAQITASEHSSLYKFTFFDNKQPQLLIDFQSGVVGNHKKMNNHVLASKIDIVDSTTIIGTTTTNVWLERTYSYIIKFDKPFVSKVLLKARNENEEAPRYVFNFNLEPGEKLMVKIALSTSNEEAAEKNLKAEIPSWNFDETRYKAQQKWKTYLSRIEVDGTDDQKTKFYTAMYHLCMQPNNTADVGQAPFYSTLSLWDTYRAAHPLYSIMAPEKVDDFINSMLHQYDNQGFLPLWALWGNETYCMIGNHSVPVIVDAYLKGFNGFDAEQAYQAVKSSLTNSHNKSNWEIYDKYGYYPFDLVRVESVSRTLESAYDDYCAAQFAKALGKTSDYEYFLKRSNYYKNLFDPETRLMRGKDSSGNWRTPFNSFLLSHAETKGGDYTEGNAWQYTWHVQHDVRGLISLMGGDKYFTTRLDSLFEMSETQEGMGFQSDVTGLIGQYAHGNEPSHHVSYLYTLAGAPSKTQELVHKICNTKYLDQVDGLCGNEDCGQMSAWYIFSSMGFYPVNPCGGEYVLGAPQLPEAVLHLSNGKVFEIQTENFSSENIYVGKVELNGRRYNKSTINHEDIMNGGILKFYMRSDVSNETKL